jgi:hypothetical protein
MGVAGEVGMDRCNGYRNIYTMELRYGHWKNAEAILMSN